MSSRGLGLLMVCGVLSACTGPAAPKGSPESRDDAAGNLNELATSRQALIDPCALLDQPFVRRRMSGAYETHLLQTCGRTLKRSVSGKQAPGARASAAAQGEPLPRPSAAALDAGNIDILVNDPSLDQGGTTQSETTIVAHGNVVCAAWNDAGEGFGANGFSGFGVSNDGGKTFRDGGPFPSSSGDVNFGDPSLAYSERDQAFYYAALSALGLSLWRSSDDCQSFVYVGPIHQGFGDDKELIAVDNSPESPHFGRIYMGWTDFAQAFDANAVTFSDDGGGSWSPEANLVGSGNSGQGMWPAIAPNGDVYFALANLAFEIGGLQDQWIYKGVEVEGGLTWEKQPDIASGLLAPEDVQATANCGRPALNGDIRNLSSPQIAIHTDPSAPAGYVIDAVYPYDSDGAGPDHSNVFYRRSVDAAQTWSPELQLNDDGTSTDQWFPALGADATGTLAASWYDRRLDPESNFTFDRFVSYSTDGGFTWTPNERLSDTSSSVAQTNPNFDGLATCYHGDYDQVSVQNGLAHVFWSDDRRITESGPNPDVYYDQVSLNPSKGRLSAAPNPVSCDGNLQIRLTDIDLVGVGTQPITLFTNSGDLETLTLVEGGGQPGSFSASLATASGLPLLGDGVLELSPDDGILAAYFDEDTGAGESELITFDVSVDCVAPQITSVEVSVTGDTARVDVTTSEPSTLRVDYGFSCNERVLSETAQGSNVRLEALVPGAHYFFSVTATDRAGNSSSDDNGGACYTFTAPSQVFFEDFESGLGSFSIDNDVGLGNGLWHASDSCASALFGHTRPGSLYYGQDSSCTFNNGLGNEGVARSPVIALATSSGAALEFDYFLGTEGGGFYDQASVAVSVNGGPFQIVESNFSALFDPEEGEEEGEGELSIRVRDDAVSAPGNALSDNSGHWNHAVVDLQPLLAGDSTPNIQIELRFNSIDAGANDFAGFYVDDVRVLASVRPASCSTDADCDDGSYCTGREACVDGSCTVGIPVTCAPDDDGVDCTEARCDDAAQGCISSPNDERCDDAAFCNGFERCDARLGCQAGAVVVCDDGIDCTLDQCREDLAACGGLPQSELCQDGVFCNGSELCDLVRGCIPGPLACEDGVACTQDICTEETFSCESVPVSALCDDGLFCDGTETCDPFLGCLAGQAPCAGQSCNEAQNQCAAECFSASNGEHVSGGRAQFFLDTVYLALGSEDFLGTDAEEVTSLQGGAGFWEQVESCPAAPVIRSLSVRVVGDVAIVSGTADDANDDLESVILTFNVFGLPFEVQALGTSEFSLSLPLPFPGEYFVTAQAFDRQGFASDPSAPLVFDVLNPAPPTIDSISVAQVDGATEVGGSATDPNGDIERVVVTVLQGGEVVASAESGEADPYSVRFDTLAIGSYTARAQAFDSAGLASTLSPEVPFVVSAGSNLQCILASNVDHQAAGRATALLGDTFFFAVGSNDFLGVGGATESALRGSGSFWEHVESCAPALLPPTVLVGAANQPPIRQLPE
jgi:hypothetical protein